MSLTAPETIVCAFVAIQHLGFLVLEMFIWHKPAGLRIFRMDREYALRSRGLAANQGLYNGFLAAGLAAAILHPDGATADFVARLFLAFVIVAGAFGGATVNRRILWMQAGPAAIALAVVALS